MRQGKQLVAEKRSAEQASDLLVDPCYLHVHPMPRWRSGVGLFYKKARQHINMWFSADELWDQPQSDVAALAAS